MNNNLVNLYFSLYHSRKNCKKTNSFVPIKEKDNKSILKQAYFPEYQKVQGAFKDSMIHEILQFTLLIAIRCVLHRYESQEIRCQKLFFLFIVKPCGLNVKRCKDKCFEERLTAPCHIQITYFGVKSDPIKGISRYNHFINDPTAGSPTVTLLRLLLPLNDQV